MYSTYRIKITRQNGEIEYVKRTWPEVFVTADATDAFEFHYRDSAERWIECDGGCGCAIEDVEHMEYADVVAWIVDDYNTHLPLNCEDGISAEQVTPQFALDYLSDCYNDGGYDDSRPKRGDNVELDLMLNIVMAVPQDRFISEQGIDFRIRAYPDRKCVSWKNRSGHYEDIAWVQNERITRINKPIPAPRPVYEVLQSVVVSSLTHQETRG